MNSPLDPSTTIPSRSVSPHRSRLCLSLLKSMDSSSLNGVTIGVYIPLNILIPLCLFSVMYHTRRSILASGRWSASPGRQAKHLLLWCVFIENLLGPIRIEEATYAWMCDL